MGAKDRLDGRNRLMCSPLINTGLHTYAVLLLIAHLVMPRINTGLLIWYGKEVNEMNAMPNDAFERLITYLKRGHTLMDVVDSFEPNNNLICIRNEVVYNDDFEKFFNAMGCVVLFMLKENKVVIEDQYMHRAIIPYETCQGLGKRIVNFNSFTYYESPRIDLGLLISQKGLKEKNV